MERERVKRDGSIESGKRRRVFQLRALGANMHLLSEFNRISVEVLSVVAVQVKSVQDAIRDKKDIFNFMGEMIKCVPTVGIFITMNPGELHWHVKWLPLHSVLTCTLLTFPLCRLRGQNRTTYVKYALFIIIKLNGKTNRIVSIVYSCSSFANASGKFESAIPTLRNGCTRFRIDMVLKIHLELCHHKTGK